MADRKISDLTALTTPASGDYLPIVDISEAAASSKNKRITIEELFRGVPLGTAAAPSIAIEGDENTGIYSPGADQLAISTNGSERARTDSSGRLLVGTSSARSTSTVSWLSQIEGGATTGLGITTNNDSTDGAYLSLAKSRGTSVGSNTIVQNSDGLGYILFSGADGNDANTQAALIGCEVDGTPGADDMPGRLVFSTTSDSASSPTERLRIDSTGRIIGSTGGLDITRTVDSAAALATFISSSATTANQYGLYVRLDGDPNNTGQYFLECYGGVSNRRATIRSNGGLANYQSNNVDLSDERTKRDIVSAPSTWDCVQSWNVVNYNYLDDAQDESTRIGVTAQQVQQHCPEVVIPYQEAEDAVLDGDGSVVTPAIEERLGVREQQMMWMAIKALQEAQLRIETLEAEVAALKAS